MSPSFQSFIFSHISPRPWRHISFHRGRPGSQALGDRHLLQAGLPLGGSRLHYPTFLLYTITRCCLSFRLSKRTLRARFDRECIYTSRVCSLSYASLSNVSSFVLVELNIYFCPLCMACTNDTHAQLAKNNGCSKRR